MKHSPQQRHAERFGLYDTVDACWIGDKDGPRLFDDPALAKIGARVLDVRLGYEPGRIRERPYLERAVRLRDNVDTKMDSLEALKLLESGKA